MKRKNETAIVPIGEGEIMLDGDIVRVRYQPRFFPGVVLKFYDRAPRPKTTVLREKA